MKEEGAIVGLPLEILIAVVVAAVALAAILSFMVTSGPQINSWQIYVDGKLTKNINATTQPDGSAVWNGTITIVVEDQNGHPLPNVKVLLDGCGVTAAGQTNAKGVATIHLNNVTLPSGVTSDEIKVTLSYPGLIGEQTKSDSLTVIRASP